MADQKLLSWKEIKAQTDAPGVESGGAPQKPLSWEEIKAQTDAPASISASPETAGIAESGISTSRGRALAASQAITLGSADEALGGAAGIYEGIKGRLNDPVVQDPIDQLIGFVSRAVAGSRDIQSAQKSNIADAYQKDPLGMIGTGLGAGVALGAPGVALAKALPASGFVQGMGATTAIGTVAGGMTADPGNRAAGAAQGGLFAAATGLPIHGFTSLQRRFAPGAIRRLAELAETTGETVQEMKQKLLVMTKYGGKGQVTLADVNDTFGLATQSVAQRVGPARKEIARLAQRDKEAFGRITAFLNKRVGGVESRATTINDLKSIQTNKAKPLFDEAEEVGYLMTPRLKHLFKRPEAQRAWRQVMREGLNDPDITPDMLHRVQFDPKADLDPSMEGWMRMNTVFHNRIKQLRAAKNPQFGHTINNLRKEIKGILTKHNKPYEKALDTWAGTQRAEEMLNEGEKFMTMHSDDLAAMMKDLDGADRVFFRMGASRAIENKLARLDDSLDTSKMFRNPSFRRKAAALFGNKKDAADFIEMVDVERQFKLTLRRQQGGSPTAINLNIQKQLEGGIAAPPLTQHGVISRALVSASKASDATMAEIGRRLSSHDPKTIAETLELMQRAGMTADQLGPFAAVAAANAGVAAGSVSLK